MRTSQIVVLVALIGGIFASLDLRSSHAQIALAPPHPFQGDDYGSSSTNCLPNDPTWLSSNLKILDYETAIEDIASSIPVIDYQVLAHHVVSQAKEALGFEAILSDEVLASLAWSFRLRHIPPPIIIAEQSTLGDADRLVRHVLTNHKVKYAHHFSEVKILELIAAVKNSVNSPKGFIFRIIEGEDSEYHPLHLHQLAARQHYFAAVHNARDLFVTFVGSEVLGEFIKGHGGADAVVERASAAQFLRQWLLNQWVNLWICTNPRSGSC